MTVNQLERQRQEAGAMVYRWFRFRARRGLGLVYCLLSFLPVFGQILSAISSSTPIALVGSTVAAICSLAVIRSAGLRGFGTMGSTVDALRGRGVLHNWNRAAFVSLFVILWPWIGYAVARYNGEGMVAALFAGFWLVELVLYRVVTIRRTKDPIVDSRIEDWLVLISFPVGAILNDPQILQGPLQTYGFVLISPALLFAGVKSLYDAPKELVVDHDTEQE